MLGPLGAPAGNLETFIEVPFMLGDKRCYPDGLIRVVRGTRTWTALVEVKTGKSELEPVQLENYLDVAREQGFDALITVSNEIPPMAGQHPTKLDKRKLRKVDLHHWSWTYLLSTAVMQKEHRGVSDPEQAWILGELIRYLEHPRSGPGRFQRQIAAPRSRATRRRRLMRVEEPRHRERGSHRAPHPVPAPTLAVAGEASRTTRVATGA